MRALQEWRSAVEELFDAIAAKEVDPRSWWQHFGSKDRAKQVLNALWRATDQLPRYVVEEVRGWLGYENARTYAALAQKMSRELR